MFQRPLTIIAFCLLVPVGARAQGAPDSTTAASVSGYHSPDRILEFADFLWGMEEYERAIGEYQRYQFASGGSTPSVQFRLGQCCFRLDRYREAARYFGESARMPSRQAFRDSALAGFSNALYRAHDSGALLHFADSVAAAPGSPYLQEHLAALRTLTLMQQCRWKEAGSVATRFASVFSDSSIASLAELSRKGLALPHKSPLLAAALSTLLPGSGKVYCGRTFDGIYSLLLVGGSSWLAYEGFRDHGVSSGKGWVFGGAAALLYAGNIYGSGIAARIYNQGETEKLLNDVRIQVDYWTRF
jgi:TM2 domain-containing membrane protein YozV